MSKKFSKIILSIVMLSYFILPCFNLMVIYAQEYIAIGNLIVENSVIELSTGEKETIRYSVFPVDANTESIKFSSRDESIAKVNDAGEVTGLKKGFTFVDIEYEVNYGVSVLVAVDMSPEESLNELLDLVPSNLKSQYYELSYNDLESILRNNILMPLYHKDIYDIYCDVYQENGKNYFKLGFMGITSEAKEFTYTFYGINVEKNRYLLEVGDEVDTKLSFSEGTNSNLEFAIMQDKNDPTVSYKDGKIKALKPGLVTIDIHDKYYKYYNTIYVFVEPDEVLEEFSKNKISINANQLSNLSISEVSNFLISSLRTQHSAIYDLIGWVSPDECNEISKKCNISINKEIEGKTFTYNGDFEYELRGIYLDNNENDYVTVGINEEKEIKYISYEEGDVTINSLTPEVCSISDGNKIKGLKAGYCDIELTSGDYYNLVIGVVGIDEIYSNLQSGLNSLSDKLTVSAVSNFINYYDHPMLGEFNFMALQNALNKLLGENSISKFMVDYFEFEDFNDKKSISLTPYYNTAYKDVYRNFYGYELEGNQKIEKEFEFEPNNVNNNILVEAKSILDKVENVYKVSMDSYLEYNLKNQSTMNEELYRYSNIMKLLDGHPGFDYYLSIRKGDMSPENIMIGGFIVLTYNDVAVGMKETEFQVSCELDKGKLSEEEYIDKIKETVSDSYLKAKNKSMARRMGIMSIQEPQVDVKYKFNEELQKGYYLAKVDNIELVFAAPKLNGAYILNDDITKELPTLKGSSNLNSNTINITNIPIAEGYEIYKSTDNKTFKLYKTTTSLTTTIGSLKFNTSNYYKVRAYKTIDGKKVYSKYSSVLKLTTKLNQGKASASNTSYNKNKVSITKVSGASGYEIYYSTNNKTFKLLKRTTSLSYTHSSLKTGTTYYYKVRAYKTVSGKRVYGAFSPVVNKKPVLKTPGTLKVSKTSKQHKITVPKVSGASGYEYYVSTDGVTFKKLSTKKANYYINKSIKSGKTHYYKVRAYRTVSGKKKYSSYSKVLTVK